MKIFSLSIITSKYRANLILDEYKNFLKNGSKVLDVGCGTGIVASVLSNNLNIKITGCDVKNYLQTPLPFAYIEKNGRLPFSANSFDIVMLNDVLHHIESDQQIKLIKEALRVGKSVLIFEAKPTFTGKLFDILLNKFHYGDLNAPLTFRNIENWTNIFKTLKVKCKVKKIDKSFFYPFSHILFYLKKPSKNE